ncbi:MAG: hypothetical protein K2X66_09225 [Cyanobacteria bacterium]|nr:hypothetical protein [Cyanobacteriota bacterium]
MPLVSLLVLAVNLLLSKRFMFKVFYTTLIGMACLFGCLRPAMAAVPTTGNVLPETAPSAWHLQMPASLAWVNQDELIGRPINVQNDFQQQIIKTLSLQNQLKRNFNQEMAVPAQIHIPDGLIPRIPNLLKLH